MKLIATMPVRSESWILGLSLRVVLKWCDEVIVLNHCSRDTTVDIVGEVSEEHPGRVIFIDDQNPEWSEMAHRQRLLDAARARGATHVAITDADECLTGNRLEGIRAQIASLPPGATLQVGMPAMWRGLDKYRYDGSCWSRRYDLVLAFADRHDLCWQRTNGYDHHQRAPRNSRVGHQSFIDGGVMHLQFASWRRLVAKHALYKIMERLKYPDKRVADIDWMYTLATNEDGIRLVDAPAEWWEPYKDLMHHADLNAVPWHEAECKRLWMEHGVDRFQGLNLFGVVGETVTA